MGARESRRVGKLAPLGNSPTSSLSEISCRWKDSLDFYNEFGRWPSYRAITNTLFYLVFNFSAPVRRVTAMPAAAVYRVATLTPDKNAGAAVGVCDWAFTESIHRIQGEVFRVRF